MVVGRSRGGAPSSSVVEEHEAWVAFGEVEEAAARLRAVAVPIGQHPAFGTATSDLMNVDTGPVRMAVNQTLDARAFERRDDRLRRHVHEARGRRAERWVLPDWDCDSAEPRGGFLDFTEGRPRLVFFDD